MAIEAAPRRGRGGAGVVWVEVSWGDVNGGEATGPLVVPLARSCISLALDVLS